LPNGGVVEDLRGCQRGLREANAGNVVLRCEVGDAEAGDSGVEQLLSSRLGGSRVWPEGPKGVCAGGKTSEQDGDGSGASHERLVSQTLMIAEVSRCRRGRAQQGGAVRRG